MDFRWSDKKYEKKFAKKDIEVTTDIFKKGKKQIHCVATGDSTKQSLFFIHGAPGSARDFKTYLWDKDLLDQSNMRAVDRPGYGFSNYGQSEKSIIEQANQIQQVIEDSSIVVGHSFGGPVAAAIAMYYPHKVKQLILLAPAIDPNNEKQFLPKAFGKSPLKYLFSPAIQVAFDEKLSHETALIELMNDWSKITCPVTIMHGKKDNIVPFENVAFLQKELVNAPLEFKTEEDMNHIMIWTDFEFVKQLLLEKLD